MAKRRYQKRGEPARMIDTIAPKLSPVSLRCIYHTRVVVGPERTATGARYDFGSGEVKSVAAIDAPKLLALEKPQMPGCCGNDPNPPPLKYFEKA